MNDSSSRQALLRQFVPPLAGLLLIALFVNLGLWQLDRAAEKNALLEAFENPKEYVKVAADLSPEPYQALRADGSYLADRQILIDNAVQDGKLGYFVISPFDLDETQPLLLVNRGWMAKPRGNQPAPDLSLGAESRKLQGKTGNLPRVGIRPGEAFEGEQSWPRIGVWPTGDEIAAELGREVLPFVLLLDPQQSDGFVRHWQPRESGASTHFAYAFQWFAMMAAVIALLGWHSYRNWKQAREKRVE